MKTRGFINVFDDWDLCVADDLYVAALGEVVAADDASDFVEVVLGRVFRDIT